METLIDNDNSIDDANIDSLEVSKYLLKMSKIQNDEIIKAILRKNKINFSSIISITESNNNLVFAIDDIYVLKWKNSNSILFLENMAIELVRPYATMVPEVVFFDSNRNGEFLLLKRLPGNPLNSEWKYWSVNKRKAVLKDIISELKKIHNVPVAERIFRETWLKKEYTNTSYSKLLKDVFFDGKELAQKNPFLAMNELEELSDLFIKTYEIFNEAEPSFVHHDFWYKNILVDKNGLTGIIDFELSGYVPKQVELFLFLYSKQTAKNYIDDGSEDYTELEFLDMLLNKLGTEYPELENSFDPKGLLVYSLCKYMSLLSRWQESWYSHTEAKKFFEVFIRDGLRTESIVL